MATQNPFDDKTFVKIMKGILDLVDYNKNAICSAMGLIDKKEQPIPYYTMDCALCYTTYMEIHENPQFQKESQNLIKRAQRNMALMEQTHKGDGY
jgi:hypothetical protein